MATKSRFSTYSHSNILYINIYSEILKHLCNFPQIFSFLIVRIVISQGLFSLLPEVKAQQPLNHPLSGLVRKIHWAFEKTVNHGGTFPIFRVSCRAGEQRVIVTFVEEEDD